MRLTLAIVGKTLFDTDVEAHARDVGIAMTAVMESFWMLMLPFAHLIERLPVPRLRRSRMARAELDAIIYGMIAERRRSPGDRGDLLSMLLEAQDEEGSSEDHPHGRGMTDQQLRDEAMTIFLAGHETTANALTWTWYLLSGAPEVEARLHDEIDRVLGGRLPTVADISSLSFVERVVTESMRLYPPAWISAGGPSSLTRLMTTCRRCGPLSSSARIVHRDAHFPSPTGFCRIGGLRAESVVAAVCLPAVRRRDTPLHRESFAWMELVLVLTTIAQLAAASRPRTSGGPASLRHPPHEARDEDDRNRALKPPPDGRA